MTDIDDLLGRLDETWPQLGRGGFYRNFHGEAVISHPDGGKRTLIYRGASSWWPWTGRYDGDPIYGERGTWVHTLCDIADGHDQLPDGFVDAGIDMGIPLQLQIHIELSWLKFRDAHRIEVHAIEQTFVNDRAKCASNCDRIVSIDGGPWVGGDIKTSGNVTKKVYAAQLSMIVGSQKYDPETGGREDWEQPIDARYGYIFWFPLNKAIKAINVAWQEDDLPDWEMVRVDLTGITETCDTLIDIRDTDMPADCFTTVGVRGPVEEWLRQRIIKLAAIDRALPLLERGMRPEWGSLSTSINLEFEADIIGVLEKIEDALQMPWEPRHPSQPKGRRTKK